MIISFSYPTTSQFGGGIATLFEYANGLARLGHEIHFIHGPAINNQITSVEDLAWFRFESSVHHHIVTSLEDPRLPAADVIFQEQAPRRLGQPAVLIQGYKLLSTAFERPAFRAACPKLCVASWLTEIGEAWGSEPNQMLYSPLGIDQEQFQIRTPIADRPIDVAMLYTTHPVKGAEDGLAALDALRRRHRHLRIVLFGLEAPGPLPDWVEHRQGLNRDLLAREVFGKAKILLQPSWREGFGLTSIEAMACGSALVTTDNGGSRDYAQDSETASVVPRHDPPGLTNALDHLLGDEATRQRLARAGAVRAASFTWDNAARTMEAHLQRYLGDPRQFQAAPADAPMFLEDSW